MDIEQQIAELRHLIDDGLKGAHTNTNNLRSELQKEFANRLNGLEADFVKLKSQWRDEHTLKSMIEFGEKKFTEWEATMMRQQETITMLAQRVDLIETNNNLLRAQAMQQGIKLTG